MARSKTVKPKAPSESQNQESYFDWAKLHPVARRAYAIPNGGFRRIQTAVKLKKEGVRKGVLDTHLPVACGGCHGLWIEMKAGYNQMTAEQEAEAAHLVKDGFAVGVCWETESAIKLTTDYLAGEIGPSLWILKPAPKPRASAG